MKIEIIKTKPFEDQKPGTSGLRKKTKVFEQEHYLENFVQSIFNVIGSSEDFKKPLIVGGDGRYYNDVAIQKIVAVALANGCKKVLIGQNGIFSTPAVSASIRKRQAFGAIVLSASHNPGGPNEDFGIKFNMSNGGPSPSQVTDLIFEETLKITEYKKIVCEPFCLSAVASFEIADAVVEVINPVSDYADLMEELFDFKMISKYLADQGRMLFDGMNAVTGPYAEEIFINRMGASPECLMRSIPLQDFGGIHPDPNLVYAKELVEKTRSDQSPEFAAASDGDGDRNMILGDHFFVSPGDSLAVIVDQLESVAPGYAEGLKGVARSMPTSHAVDRVAKAKGIPCYETPTGWKYFGNLMDAGLCTVCGEESFGTSSSHIREKDGLWAVLAWLSILSKQNKSVTDVVTDHWHKYGRDYFQRYDFEALPLEPAKKMMVALKEKIADSDCVEIPGYDVASADSFSYEDVVDHSISKNQGYRIFFKSGERLVFRLSGTGTQGATLRMYVEAYSKDEVDLTANEKLGQLAKASIEFIELQKYCERSEPDVIT